MKQSPPTSPSKEQKDKIKVVNVDLTKNQSYAQIHKKQSPPTSPSKEQKDKIKVVNVDLTKNQSYAQVHKNHLQYRKSTSQSSPRGDSNLNDENLKLITLPDSETKGNGKQSKKRKRESPPKIKNTPKKEGPNSVNPIFHHQNTGSYDSMGRIEESKSKQNTPEKGYSKKSPPTLLSKPQESPNYDKIREENLKRTKVTPQDAPSGASNPDEKITVHLSKQKVTTNKPTSNQGSNNSFVHNPPIERINDGDGQLPRNNGLSKNSGKQDSPDKKKEKEEKEKKEGRDEILDLKYWYDDTDIQELTKNMISTRKVVVYLEDTAHIPPVLKPSTLENFLGTENDDACVLLVHLENRNLLGGGATAGHYVGLYKDKEHNKILYIDPEGKGIAPNLEQKIRDLSKKEVECLLDKSKNCRLQIPEPIIGMEEEVAQPNCGPFVIWALQQCITNNQGAITALAKKITDFKSSNEKAAEFRAAQYNQLRKKVVNNNQRKKGQIAFNDLPLEIQMQALRQQYIARPRNLDEVLARSLRSETERTQNDSLPTILPFARNLDEAPDRFLHSETEGTKNDSPPGSELVSVSSNTSPYNIRSETGMFRNPISKDSDKFDTQSQATDIQPNYDPTVRIWYRSLEATNSDKHIDHLKKSLEAQNTSLKLEPVRLGIAKNAKDKDKDKIPTTAYYKQINALLAADLNAFKESNLVNPDLIVLGEFTPHDPRGSQAPNGYIMLGHVDLSGATGVDRKLTRGMTVYANTDSMQWGRITIHDVINSRDIFNKAMDNNLQKLNEFTNSLNIGFPQEKHGHIPSRLPYKQRLAVISHKGGSADLDKIRAGKEGWEKDYDKDREFNQNALRKAVKHLGQFIEVDIANILVGLVHTKGCGDDAREHTKEAINIIPHLNGFGDTNLSLDTKKVQAHEFVMNFPKGKNSIPTHYAIGNTTPIGTDNVPNKMGSTCGAQDTAHDVGWVYNKHGPAFRIVGSRWATHIDDKNEMRLSSDHKGIYIEVKPQNVAHQKNAAHAAKLV